MKDIIQVTRYMNEFGYIMVIKLKLLQLKEMLDAGLISESEYNAKKADLLSRM